MLIILTSDWLMLIILTSDWLMLIILTSDWLMLIILTSDWLTGYAVHPMAIDQDLMVAARVMDKPGLELRNVDKMYPEYRCVILASDWSRLITWPLIG